MYLNNGYCSYRITIQYNDKTHNDFVEKHVKYSSHTQDLNIKTPKLLKYKINYS